MRVIPSYFIAFYQSINLREHDLHHTIPNILGLIGLKENVFTPTQYKQGLCTSPLINPPPEKELLLAVACNAHQHGTPIITQTLLAFTMEQDMVDYIVKFIWPVMPYFFLFVFILVIRNP